LTPEHHAQRAIIVSLLPRVRKFAFSLTGSLADADDLLQSTVERALIRRDPGVDEEALLKWMFTVCRNLWVDELRARQVRGASDPYPEDVDTLSADSVGDPTVALAFRDLDHALGRLSEDQRAVLALVGVEGYGYQEAADVLGIPVGTVMSRLARARRQLAEHFQGGNKSPP
jgi:RNA polymerase sigma-70 factor (ECF subfamily)